MLCTFSKNVFFFPLKVTNSAVSVIEQNASPTGKNSYSRDRVECYLTA